MLFLKPLKNLHGHLGQAHLTRGKLLGMMVHVRLGAKDSLVETTLSDKC